MEKEIKVIVSNKISQTDLDNLKVLAGIRRKKTNERKGQAFYNVLFSHFPSLAHEIVSTSIDPFYKDEILEDCYVAIVQ